MKEDYNIIHIIGEFSDLRELEGIFNEIISSFEEKVDNIIINKPKAKVKLFVSNKKTEEQNKVEKIISRRILLDIEKEEKDGFFYWLIPSRINYKK